MAVSISLSIAACLKAFNQFIDEIQDANMQGRAGLVIQPWQDELGRLRMWAANIGAHQTNQSSLDYRLRDSAHIRIHVTKLLEELVQRLGEASAVIRNETDDDDDVESLQGSSSEDEEPQSEMQQLQRSVATIINCLFQMSMLVRKPAQHDRRVASDKADVAHFELYDHNHVRDKFPRADDMIVSRLSRAMTRRRKYLKYRERHAMKLRQGINTAEGVKDTATSAGALSETVVTAMQGPNIDFQGNASDSGNSQTSYASTLISGGNITIPAPPKASQGGEPFECPYCRFIITAKSTRLWNRHVFNDLQPYVCMEKSCVTPDKLYATRHEWIHHCRNAHPIENPPRAGKEKEQDESRCCTLCGDTQDTRDRKERHIAQHLQELALFVLPRDVEEEIHAVKCLCGSDDDDSDTILCEACETRQHTDCYYSYHGAVPIEHYCTDCKPRPLIIQGARTSRRERQRKRNASGSSESSGTASEEELVHNHRPTPSPDSDDESSNKDIKADPKQGRNQESNPPSPQPLPLSENISKCVNALITSIYHSI
ncbi:MAG: hypothetical protein Q9196_003530 [Gyalolechia fulgens]